MTGTPRDPTIDASIPAGSELPIANDHEERAAYIVDGAVTCGSERADEFVPLPEWPG